MNKENKEVLILKGTCAFSDFRMASLLEKINKYSIKANSIEAEYVYFLNINGELSHQILAKVMSLLGAISEFTYSGGFFVTPRKGTISPWSSKATDIFHNCGLLQVKRVERGIYFLIKDKEKVIGVKELGSVLNLLHDRMTEGIYCDVSDIFTRLTPSPLVVIDILREGKKAIKKANKEMGLALNDEEIDYLFNAYYAIQRNPTDVELVMFGQVNSEHCRHKIFNAAWIIDGEEKTVSLFEMIKKTHALHSNRTLVAYKDNAGIIEGYKTEYFEAGVDEKCAYNFSLTQTDLVMKVETHNHPTAISPYPGAATGVGGEIRDESATGIGGKSMAGLCGFMVSNLNIPDFIMPWEKRYAEFPSRLASPLMIMLEGPIGGAGFGNEFGRPQLAGFFRTYEGMWNGKYRGYHKPIMLAGGMGTIKREHIYKKKIPQGALIIQIGGPAMKIGLGGGAASSMATGSNAENLDFDSVQRGNAEMERRCQQVIDSCIALGEKNPIISIHDIGAGGLSNGCPELVAEVGGHFYLRRIPSEDTSMSPMQIWCCEAQERYVLAILPESLELFKKICQKERCPFAVIGEVTGDGRLLLEDELFQTKPIDVEMSVLLGKPPKMIKKVKHLPVKLRRPSFAKIEIDEAVKRVLRAPCVADKTFLITIADRTVKGMTHRDQMVGPYQVPVADAAVVTISYKGYAGQAMAIGERSVVSLISGPASGRLAIAEALTNIAAVDTGGLQNIKLSANWMCACGEEGEDAILFDTVQAVSDFCIKLGVSIPVGKDSLSMRTLWKDSKGIEHKQTAPLSLIISAFSPVDDVRKTVTPDLKKGDSRLLLCDLGRGLNRLGCSVLAQVYNITGGDCPDVEYPSELVRFFAAVQELTARGLLMAYHDRSDGGLFVTLAEMMFAGRIGIDVDIGSGTNVLGKLFSEEIGAVMQIADDNFGEVLNVIKKHRIEEMCSVIGKPSPHKIMRISSGGKEIYKEDMVTLKRLWSELTYRMQSLRDNPVCAKEEYDNILDTEDPGMQFCVTWKDEAPFSISLLKPPIAILREQGVNGHVEMAAAFHMAGFECFDVHMTDLLSGRIDINDFVGFVACGGFSYGDVLGAGSGWAKSILYNERLKEEFAKFFARQDTFALGVCNGCQMLSQLKDLIPGAEEWPAFTRNKSEQFEARYVSVRVEKSPSIFLNDMEGSILGIVVAHGEGFADFSKMGSLSSLKERNLISIRYVDNRANPTERYPYNPNGSPEGVTGFTTPDGRVTIMMPHPERGFRSVQMSYRPKDLFMGEDGPWMKMFRNARAFVKK